MNTRTRTLSALALGAASLLTPAYADTPEARGVVCGFASSDDPSRVIVQDPNIQTGELHIGPVTVADLLNEAGTGPSGDTDVVSADIHCWIQVNNDVNNDASHAAEPAGASCHGSGTALVVSAPPCVISYTASLSDNVFLCARIDFHHAGGTQVVYRDGDPNKAGIQCLLAISAGA